MASQDEKLLSARSIGQRFGREARIVQLWFKQGCPHVREKYGNQVRVKARPADVARWLSGQGLDLHKGEAPRDVIAAPPQSGAGPLWEEHRKDSEAEREAKIRALMGPLDYDRMIAGLQLQAAEIDTRMRAKDVLAGEMDRLAGAKQKLVQEVRHLEGMRAESIERSDRLMERSKAIEAHRGLAELLVAGLEGLRSDAVRELMGRLDGMVPAARADEARRVCEQAVDGAVMGMRQRVWETVMRMVGEEEKKAAG